jgi:8-oxo-dGTP diphosphatase
MPGGRAGSAFAVADARPAASNAMHAAERERQSAGVIGVAVAVVRSEAGHVLLAERTARQISAGFWEFPGGKIDPGESPQEAALRELAEEVGISGEQPRPWIVYEHQFPTKRVRLHVFTIGMWSGTPHGREGQRIAWVDPALPALGPVLASNRRLLAALALPAVVAFTPCGDARRAQAFSAALPAIFRAGTRAVVIRERHLPPDQRIAFARRVHEIAQLHGVRTFMGGSALEARRAGIASVHSDGRELWRLVQRPPAELWGVDCRDAADVERAQRLGADFATIGPVVADPTCAGLAAIGWDAFGELTRRIAIPVYAYGGIGTDALAPARRAGAIGVAVTDAARSPA